ncbi:outer membrane protein transport protein [Parabacteroides sp. OttesenSCG-928-G21]|nr:outer membrane protein transport protein [Parabacteroides sp. OttesenSCG-928-G21]
MVTLALCGGVAFSQSHLDAYKYAQSELNGTARYLGMGGAFGALGGDISAMKNNPAGLAIYRSSEVVTTLSLNNTNTETNWENVIEKNSRTHFNFDNIAYVGYFPTGKSEGVIGWNAGFAYNRLKNFKRNYSMSAGGAMRTSLSDYIAERAYGNPVSKLEETSANRPYDYLDWLPVLGYNAGFIDPYSHNDEEYYSVFTQKEGDDWVPYTINNSVLQVSESGAIDQYDISFGMNINDRVFLGATMAITDISYNYESTYDEYFDHENNYMYLDNGLSTDGTGYSFNIGLIYRPFDFFRLGVAYNSPTWYKMTDYFYASAESYLTFMHEGEHYEQNISAHTPNGGYWDYEFTSPDKWLLSASFFFGQSGLLSFDYERVNYHNMKMYDYSGKANKDTNNDIKADIRGSNTYRVGAEYKVTPQFSIRAGGGYSTTPMKSQILNGDVNVYTVGTIPNYTLERRSSYYTVGLGYRFTPQFYADFACVFTNYKEDVYAFSNTYIWENDTKIQLIEAQPATMKTNNTRFALTLGYKF